jgi:hypothetical protein
MHMHISPAFEKRGAKSSCSKELQHQKSVAPCFALAAATAGDVCGCAWVDQQLLECRIDQQLLHWIRITWKP